MATTSVVRPSHPALAFAPPTPALQHVADPPTHPILSTNPSTPFTKHDPQTDAPKTTAKTLAPTPALPAAPPGPKVNYALLRSHQVAAMKYVIGRLRWDQNNHGYTPGESAWREHNGMIQRMEDELKEVVAAQKALDQFPDFCFAPLAPVSPKPYGPPTREQVEKAKADAKKEEEELDRELDKAYPFIRQLFIGPMTKQQAKNDRLLRKLLLDGQWQGLTRLLPSENRRLALGEEDRRHEKRRPYQEVRLEREKAKIKALQEEQAQHAPPTTTTKDEADKKEHTAKIGPMTKEEYMTTLPVFGPKTRGETLLPIQREQRHVVLNFLRKPWQQYDEEAAVLLERLGRLAVKRLSEDVKAKEKGEKQAVEVDGKKEPAKEKHASDPKLDQDKEQVKGRSELEEN